MHSIIYTGFLNAWHYLSLFFISIAIFICVFDMHSTIYTCFLNARHYFYSFFFICTALFVLVFYMYVTIYSYFYMYGTMHKCFPYVYCITLHLPWYAEHCSHMSVIVTPGHSIIHFFSRYQKYTTLFMSVLNPLHIMITFSCHTQH